MKWIIVLLILLVVIALVALRYRRQIQSGLQIWRVLRQMRQAGKSQEPAQKKKESLKEVPLVRCEKCAKWISPEGALKLRSDKYYCSSTCMEKAAKLQSLVD